MGCGIFRNTLEKARGYLNLVGTFMVLGDKVNRHTKLNRLLSTVCNIKLNKVMIV
jgi:hypothetical protein